MSTEKCDEEVYKNGTLIAVLDACKYRAETFSIAVAKDSGQRVDWHYVGGRACVAALGDISAARASADKLTPMIKIGLKRIGSECGSCNGESSHRVGYRLDR